MWLANQVTDRSQVNLEQIRQVHLPLPIGGLVLSLIMCLFMTGSAHSGRPTDQAKKHCLQNDSSRHTCD